MWCTVLAAGLGGGTGGIMPLNMLRGETVCLCGAWCALCWQQGEGTGQATCCLHRANTHTTREQADVEGALSPALSLLKFLKSSMES